MWFESTYVKLLLKKIELDSAASAAELGEGEMSREDIRGLIQNASFFPVPYSSMACELGMQDKMNALIEDHYYDVIWVPLLAKQFTAAALLTVSSWSLGVAGWTGAFLGVMWITQLMAKVVLAPVPLYPDEQCMYSLDMVTSSNKEALWCRLVEDEMIYSSCNFIDALCECYVLRMLAKPGVYGSRQEVVAWLDREKQEGEIRNQQHKKLI